jgi:CO/xanthine dehydrogenase FAD-binding subunit
LKPPPFAYHRPESRAEVDRLLAELGDDAKILAGGQSLIPILNMRLSAPAHLVDINGLADEPRDPVRDDRVVRFGPLVRHADAEHGVHPLFDAAMAFVGHPAIRSRGTVVGSVAHADPAAELPAALLALDGKVRLRSARGTRSVPANEFFVGALENACAGDEWVEEVSVPAATEGTGYAVEEFARRHGDYAICGVMAAARAESVRLVHFGIAALPVVTDVGAEDDVRARVREALENVDVADDLHGTARYRRHLAEVLGERAAARAAVRAV